MKARVTMRSALGLGFALVVYLVGSARATDRTWVKEDAGAPDSGSFGVDANWNPAAVPGDDDWIILDNAAGAAYTITLDGTRVLTDATQDTGLTVGTDKVILDLATHDLTMEASGYTGNLLLAPADGQVADFAIQGGGTFLVNNIYMSDMSSGTSTSTLTVQGTGTRLELASADDSYAGRARFEFSNGASTVTVNVLDGATFRIDKPRAYFGGSGNGSTVKMNVSTGGTLDTRGGAAESLWLSRSILHGSTTLTVDKGAFLYTDPLLSKTGVLKLDA